jgi:glycosyltransferase involved in cell wall biosynthesis
LRAQIVSGVVYLDKQACNGLRLWLENFQTVTLACPTSICLESRDDFAPLDLIPGRERLRFVSLPVAHTPHRFAAVLPRTSLLLLREIQAADCLHFAIGGLWGDWASVACLLARQRRFAVWTDRVEHEVVAFASKSKRGLRRTYTLLTARLMARYERFVIGRSALGLFHGADCYDAYAPYCRAPRLVHDIHVGADALITSGEIQERFDRPRPLRVAYAGRAHVEKGIFDWIDVMRRISTQGLEFSATWYGNGPALEAARMRAQELGLKSVRFPGAVRHDEVLRFLKSQDVFVFCHKTRESPRCLIEALQCGLPIVGYDSAFPRDLIKQNGGGLLTPPSDEAALTGALVRLERDRSSLATLTMAAARDGAQFSAEKVFRERSDLMKSIHFSECGETV